MIGAAQGVGAKVLLVGMRMPPNYGARLHAGRSSSNYRELAQLFDTALLPFLLEPIARDRNAFQADNLHPVAAGAAEAARPCVARAGAAAEVGQGCCESRTRNAESRRPPRCIRR